MVQRVETADGASYTLYIPMEDRPWLKRLLFRHGPPPPTVPLLSGLIASLVFGALLAWYVARPIRHLRGAFAALSRGELDTRVAPLIGRRRDDVADLGRDFDRMAEQLQSLIGAQRFLLHEVSHELRSPLARLQAAIGLARQNPDALDGSLERIEREAERVDELVGQLLTLSRLEARGTDTAGGAAEETDLMDLIASVAADAHFEAQTEGRSVAFSGTGEAVALVRAELVHRAVENVVRNAVRHTRPGSTVEVQAEVRSGTLVVRVADRGPGVAEADLPRIFEPFFRGADDRGGAGFGLGLAITRRAVELHGGTVWAGNRDGGGLVIELSLPLAAPAD
jgi:two-component system OmpR family sensor kinase